MPHLTAKNGWQTLIAGVIAFEIACAEGEMLSHGMDRLLEKYPIWPRIAVVLLAAHVANLIPTKYDAVSVVFNVVRGFRGVLGDRRGLRRPLRSI